MIKAVSGLNVGNSKGVFSNCQGNSNYMSSSVINNSADKLLNSKNISFKGNLANEVIGVTKKIAKELPSVKKSLIAAATDLIHIIGDGAVVVRIPLMETTVAEDIILDANNIIVPHIVDTVSDLAKEGVSKASEEVTGALAEGVGTAIKENASHGLLEGAKEAGSGILEGIKEFIVDILT